MQLWLIFNAYAFLWRALGSCPMQPYCFQVRDVEIMLLTPYSLLQEEKSTLEDYVNRKEFVPKI